MSLRAALPAFGLSLLTSNGRMSLVAQSRLMDFRFHSVEGLLQLNEGESLRLVAILNQDPGNGEFVRCMELLEGVARSEHVEFSVVSVWNGRLLEWLKRRGYVTNRNAELGVYATLRTAVRA